MISLAHPIRLLLIGKQTDGRKDITRSIQKWGLEQIFRNVIVGMINHIYPHNFLKVGINIFTKVLSTYNIVRRK